MCIICLEFNRTRDFIDAKKMIEAARREVTAVPEEHLRSIEFALQKMKDDEEERELDPLSSMDDKDP